MISLSKVSYESENRFVSSPGTVSIICYLTKYISVSQKWSLNNHNHHLPRRSDFDWCLVINFTPVRWTTGRNVRKLSMRCDSFVILHMSPKDSLHNMSGESEEKRIKHADVSPSNSSYCSKRTKSIWKHYLAQM